LTIFQPMLNSAHQCIPIHQK